MKGTLVTLAIIFAICNAEIDIRNLFSGNKVALGAYNTKLALGNLTEKYTTLTAEDVKATGNADILIELLRRMFEVGIYPLPPLDPYKKENLEPVTFNVDSLLSGKVTFSSLRVEGAKNFDLKSLELRVRKGRIDFDVDLPMIRVNVGIQTDLSLSQLIPLEFSGQLSVDLYDVKLIGALQSEVRQLEGYGNKIVFQLGGSNINFSSKDVKVSFTQSRLENDLIQSLKTAQDNPALAQWMSTFRRTMDNYVLKLFLSETNAILKSLTTAQVIAFLLPRNEP